jgi:hypothetical protein
MSFVSVKIPEGFTFYDFDKKVVKKSLREIGKDVRAEARKRISRKVVSAPSEAPGRQTGTMMKSVKSKVSKSGFSVWVTPTKTEAMGKYYYPAYVVYGHRGPHTDSISQRSKKRVGRKVAAARENFITTVAEQYERRFALTMEDAFAKAIKK